MTVLATVRPAYRIDGRDASREAFYAAACDPARNVVVEACAGAGKTWMLVSRILRALLEGTAPQEILAITFTRKAAGEMRARLDEWLLAFSDTHCSDARRTDELCARGLSRARAVALAPALGRLHEQLLSSGRRVEVRTFHAWFAQLLRAAPMDMLAQLGLHADIEVVDDIGDHWPAILRRFHAAVLADPALGADYHALVRERGRSQVGKWLQAAWDKRIEIELADAAGTLEPSVPAAAVHWPELAVFVHPSERLGTLPSRAILRAAAAAMAGQPGAVCRKQGEALRAALAIDDADGCFREARAALFTLEGKPRQRIDAPGVAEALELVDAVACACHQQAAHEEHLRMVRLTRVLLRETAAYKRLRGLADMADLERCALALLRDSTLSGWVQERLDARIRQVLVDEFQDTSPLQWQALEAWLSAYAGAGGGASGQRPPGVFIVGDPKQSIYRFRRAEPRVFDAAGHFVVDGLGGQLLTCDHTRRNAPQVLDAINGVFGEAQQGAAFSGFRAHTTELGDVTGAGVFTLERVARPAQAAAAAGLLAAQAGAAGEAGEWRDSLTRARTEIEERLRQPEARQVAAAIRALVVQGGVAAGDIQVLCRKRETLRLVAESLAEARLASAAVEEAALLESIEARDLVAVLDVLASPRHALSLAQCLRSPLFGASDDDLVALSAAASAQRDWWRALHAGGLASAPLRRAARLLAGWHAAARTLPPHDLLDRIVAEGGYRERVAAAVPAERRAAALGAIDALLALALTLDGARYATPYTFVRALKRRGVRVAAPVRPEAVQLLTVHGAKGLEARVVFVVDADPEPRNAESATLLIDWPVESPFPEHCAFVYSETRCAASLEALRDREFEARRREELNGLYVAMSRARERLVFSATEPSKPAAEPSWWQRVAAHAAPLQVPPVVPDDDPGSTTFCLDALPRWNGRAQTDPRISAQAPGPGPFDDAAASRLGSAVHRVLEWCGAQPGTSIDVAALADAAAREFQAPVRQVERLAMRIWSSPAAARFFRGEDVRWAGNEVSVADAGEVLRIDRLVELEDRGQRTWWVLDYKLAHAPEQLAAYRAQLLRYGRAVRNLQPGAAVRCAFLTGEGAVVEVESA